MVLYAIALAPTPCICTNRPLREGDVVMPIGQPHGVIYPILPFWTRMRLVTERGIDKLAFWLVDREWYAAAGFVWKIPNSWR